MAQELELEVTEAGLFSFAATQARTDALMAIASALEEDGSVPRSQYLTVAAQKLRDARTFAGEANMAGWSGEAEA